MPILGARVRDDGRVEAVVDRRIPTSEHRFRSENGLWWAEKEGQVVFFSWNGPGNDGGFGGTNFSILLEDGSPMILQGPWSSRSGIMNLYFPACMEVQLRAGDETWAGAALVSAIKRWIPVIRDPDDDEPVWRAELIVELPGGPRHVAVAGPSGLAHTLCQGRHAMQRAHGAPTCLWCVGARGRP